MLAIFDDLRRSDSSPALRCEDSFAFLNRASGIVWERQRQLLDRWYSEFPDLDGDLRRRLRARDPRQHYAAWWELYMHALLRALGYKLTVHPPVPGTTGHPDFLAERTGESFYVEAATVFSGIVAPSRGAKMKASIEDILEMVDASTFHVALRWDNVGDQMPSRQAVLAPVEAWLATLNVGKVAAAETASRHNHLWQPFTAGDWGFSLRPHAWGSRLQGCPDNPFVARRPVIAGFTNDVRQIRNAVVRKGKHYGTPDKPLVVAVLAANGFVNDRDVIGALYGSEAVRLNITTGESSESRNPDGIWTGKRGAAGRRISAVLMGVGILPNTAATAWPQLWHHYDPRYELRAELPFSTVRAMDDQLAFGDATQSTSEVFSLAPDWPGPEPAFPRCLHRPEDHAAYGSPSVDSNP
jgi:hypothetical protein